MADLLPAVLALTVLLLAAGFAAACFALFRGAGTRAHQDDAARPALRAASDAASPPHSAATAAFAAVKPSFDLAWPELASDDLLVAGVPGDDALVIAVGQTDVARALGAIEGRVPAELMATLVGSDALSKLNMSLGEQAGLLVRLTPESAAAYKRLAPTTDTAGVAMGVFKGADGKFAHVAHFQPASTTAVLGGAAGLMTALAMQAQLSAIESALAHVAYDVRLVQAYLDMDAAAEVAAVEGLLAETYAAATAAGYLTPTMWSQIAPLVWLVRKHEELADRQLQGLTSELFQLTAVRDRRAWFEKNGERLVAAVVGAQRQGRISAQLGALRLWHLAVASDPALPFYVAELRERVPQRQEMVEQVTAGLVSVVEEKRGVSTPERWLSPFDSRGVEQESRSVLAALEQVMDQYGLRAPQQQLTDGAGD